MSSNPLSVALSSHINALLDGLATDESALCLYRAMLEYAPQTVVVTHARHAIDAADEYALLNMTRDDEEALWRASNQIESGVWTTTPISNTGSH